MTDFPFDVVSMAAPEREERSERRSAWLPALVIGAFYGLFSLARVDPFRYEGVDLHVLVAASFWILAAGLIEAHRRIR